MTPRKQTNVRVGRYLRVSTDAQQVALQDDETLKVIETRGWQLVETYTDHGVSGARTSRPGLDKMLEDARRGRFDLIVCWKADRMYRSLRELLNTTELLTSWGVGFVSATEVFDTFSPQGRLMLSLLSAFSEFERAVMIERTKAGIAAARKRGKKPGRPRVYVDVRKARRLHSQGWSFKRIAKHLGIGQATLSRAFKAESGRS